MTTIARPYVAAAFEFALAKKDLAAWEAMLNTAAIIAQDKSVSRLLTNPNVTKNQLTDLFLGILEPLLDIERGNFIRLLAENNRLAALPDMAGMFKEAREAQEKVSSVEVISAIPLDSHYQQKLVQALNRRLQQQVEITNIVDPSLIGGAIIRMGDTVIDGSIRNKLNRLLEFI